ncbi:hypothetical protein EL26_01930 [Tumebacillus flagellatus]|uniref:HTH cro/C1-type domain-containing protein n=1 Tax=Tumebacillus flagellatus TaxID=1157490 RepID=A0A074LXF6_9BACL|nr:hypothetical protein EL26_01930 [Tumebacillus flagellatus]
MPRPKVVCKLDVIMSERGLTNRKLSDATGITESAISNMRNNKNKQVQFSTVEALCDFLEVDFGDLFTVRKREE